MKLNELRDALEAKGLPTKGDYDYSQLLDIPADNKSYQTVISHCLGLKSQLQARLSKAIKADTVEIETVAEEAVSEAVDANDGDKETVSQETVESMIIDDVDDSGHSNDGIDINMDDIIVIDEYDSTKKERKSKRRVRAHILCEAIHIRGNGNK